MSRVNEASAVLRLCNDLSSTARFHLYNPPAGRGERPVHDFVGGSLRFVFSEEEKPRTIFQRPTWEYPNVFVSMYILVEKIQERRVKCGWAKTFNVFK